MPPILKLLRPHQWVKNAFILAPLFFTPAAVNAQNFGRIALGVIAFCALASAVYILNDYMDRETDRQHPSKRNRPLAAGTVSEVAALILMVVLAAWGLVIAGLLNTTFLFISIGYLVVNLAYSTALKRVAILDVMLVALGYVLRVEGGAAIIGVPASVWILVCTGLVSLFIALAKRRDDIVKDLGAGHRQSLAGYNIPFLDTSIAIVLAGLLVSYLIYTTEPEAALKFGTDKLYLTTPFVIMGVLRYLQIALVEERSGSPTQIVLTDKFLILCVVAWAATFAALIYV
ncbi:decaprenyl-phosphate phosphoribosyltransferase [Lacibacterium aquatile]|uniref:Decaprenyl-phosphate phosphoribosyltransferase n=1 Tax=Lacibacterium aquatile TaxID=1168082 RepID=A0ABW5DMF6_9PROT